MIFIFFNLIIIIIIIIFFTHPASILKDLNCMLIIQHSLIKLNL